MREVTVSVDHKGKHYLTNVIADKSVSEEEILEMARQQVLKQWTIE
ncbi:BA3454 family stress response protein [Bacillus sp. REN3]|nr:BA3454 family stress response protein [Bacillus sp. REN3]